MPKLNDKRGFVTSYGHRCGYLDTAQLGDDPEHVMMGHEGAVYFVKCRISKTNPAQIWDTFDDDAAGRKTARRRFLELVRQESAVRKIGHENP
jgi:hypothetical protein